ncbi:alpha/beta hydrolase [Methanobrevibacter sp.]|uniref:alpha/beta hydrolase n=1 Tax=Methanobrevibacter sp. TaxID=66852 RepID=UPI00388E3D7D
MNKKIKIAIIIVILLVVGYATYYFTDYYHAESTATDYLNGTSNVTVSKIDNGLFLDGPGSDNALIFYPGAKVEYTSYLPMFVDLASQGVDCYLVEMPFNIAFFGQDSADSIIDSSNYTHYYLSGHSLGGLVASSYVNSTGNGDGLILFASYPTDEINKPVLSIYGTQDKVLNVNKYDESKSLMANFTEVVIEGANHEQFAYYGTQEGDGVASISPESQQKQCVDAILEFINKF